MSFEINVSPNASHVIFTGHRAVCSRTILLEVAWELLQKRIIALFRSDLFSKCTVRLPDIDGVVHLGSSAVDGVLRNLSVSNGKCSPKLCCLSTCVPIHF
jgi:hypothetical protein